jgi:hypothetical protein
MRALATINKVNCFSPAVVLALLSLLVPFIAWAEDAQNVQDESNNDNKDYSTLELQTDGQSSVRAMDNDVLESLTADIRSDHANTGQRVANYSWLHESDVKKPILGGKAARKVMRSAVKQAWKQWRDGQKETSKLLPDSKGEYSFVPHSKHADYSFRVDGHGLQMDVTVGESTSYQVELDNDGASIGYEYRF